MIKIIFEDLPCSPVVKSLDFEFRCLGFVPWLGKQVLTCYADKTILNNNNNFSVTEFLLYFLKTTAPKWAWHCVDVECIYTSTRILPTNCLSLWFHMNSLVAQMIYWRKKWQPTPVFLPGKVPWMEEPGRLQSMVLYMGVISLYYQLVMTKNLLHVQDNAIEHVIVEKICVFTRFTLLCMQYFICCIL